MSVTAFFRTFLELNHFDLTGIVLRTFHLSKISFPFLKMHILGINQGVNTLKDKRFQRNEDSGCLLLHFYGLQSLGFDRNSTKNIWLKHNLISDS